MLAHPLPPAIVAAEPDHVRFTRALPLVEAAAGHAFRAVRCPHARADLVAESVALAWKLVRDGHPAARSPAGLARHSVALARAGHTLAGD